MSTRTFVDSLTVAVLCVALSSAQTVSASKGYGYPKEEPCKFVADRSTVEASLRTSILKADTYEAAKILQSREMFSLGAGLKYKDNQTCFVVKTADRRRDPDIVAYQALALNAEKGGDTEKLARSIVLSFELDCECSLFTAKEQEKLVWEFKKILDDKRERKEILEFGKEEDDEYKSSAVSVKYHHSSGRRLMGATTTPVQTFGRRLTATEVSPVDSFVCAHCAPARQCRPASWCRKN